MALLRKRDLLGMAALLPLMVACATEQKATVTLDTAKMYADDIVNALSAAAQAYVVSPTAKDVPLVQQIVQEMQSAKAALDATQAATDARGIVLQIIGFAQQITPMVTPFLGSAGPYVPLGLVVLQAFVQTLPPPPNTPPTPPAELHAKAMTYKHPR